jgi:GR25 family glycosyltransferase involved in LPS biosynthesis
MILDITSLPTFYINLDEKLERKDKMENLLKKHNFKNFQRFPGYKADKRVGCSMSHAALLSKIIEENIFPCLVLEDDLEVLSFREKIHVPEDYDVMYLGISRYGFNSDSEEPFSKSLKVREMGEHYHRMQNMLARHAIIHNSSEYAQKSIERMNSFIDNPEKYVAGDVMISSLHPQYKVYAQNVPIFYQDAFGTRGLTKKTIFDCDYVEMDKL